MQVLKLSKLISKDFKNYVIYEKRYPRNSILNDSISLETIIPKVAVNSLKNALVC